MDLFHFDKKKRYLVVVDYYSRYPEVALLNNLKSEEIIRHLKPIFARHGIPEKLTRLVIIRSVCCFKVWAISSKVGVSPYNIKSGFSSEQRRWLKS